MEVFEPCLMDHLGEVYSQNLEYRQNIAKEAQLAEGLEKNFTEELNPVLIACPWCSIRPEIRVLHSLIRTIASLKIPGSLTFLTREK